MFYSTYVLQKKGPFAKIWIAAHWDKKLSKHDIRLIDISDVVLNLITPTVPIALRTSGELMLGLFVRLCTCIVRVFSHKVKFLLQDAQTATLRLKTMETAAPAERITLPVSKPAVQIVEEAMLPEAEDALARQALLTLRRASADEPISRIEQLGDLDEWFAVPEEKTFEASQLEAFPSLRAARELSPKPSEVSVESSVERMRQKETPVRGQAAVDVTVDVAVEDLFAPTQVHTDLCQLLSRVRPAYALLQVQPPPTPASEGALPVPMEVSVEAPPAEVAAPARKERRAKMLEIDTTTTINIATIRKHLEDTSSLVRSDVTAPMDYEVALEAAMSAIPWDARITLPIYQMPLSRTISPGFLDIWSRFVSRPTEEQEEAEVARQERERASIGPAAAVAGEFPAELERQMPYEGEVEGVAPAPFELPEGELKRKAEEDLRAAKRPRVGPEPGGMSATFQDTVGRVGDGCKDGGSIQFSKMVTGRPRRAVATAFYDLLVLKNEDRINVQQAEPYGDITITTTPHFAGVLA